MGVQVAAADGGHHYSAGRTLYSARQSNLGSERGGETYRDLHTALGRLRINVESVMFRFLFLIESLRFFSGLFV